MTEDPRVCRRRVVGGERLYVACVTCRHYNVFHPSNQNEVTGCLACLMELTYAKRDAVGIANPTRVTASDDFAALIQREIRVREDGDDRRRG